MPEPLEEHKLSSEWLASVREHLYFFYKMIAVISLKLREKHPCFSSIEFQSSTKYKGING